MISHIKPTVCLNMIVKNESSVIQRCLESLKDHIDYWVIADTGSTDNTKELIIQTLEGIPGELIDVEWLNFAHARTEVLKTARGKADYNLIIDADETLNPSENFKDDLMGDCIYGTIKYTSGFQFKRPMFLKDSADWVYQGVIHNYPVSNHQNVSSGSIETCSITHHCDGHSHSNSRSKYLNNARILEAELEKNPTDTRSAFYLGESYRDANEPEKAIEAYRNRINMGGWEEEVFWSYYQIARISNDINLYFDAYEYRPSRIEPLYNVANLLYKSHKFNGARVVLESIVNKPVPNDILFLDVSLYTWRAKDLLALVYYKLKEFKLSEEVYHHLLTVVPQSEKKRITDNIAWCHKNL